MGGTIVPRRALARQARRTQRIIQLQIAGLTQSEIVVQLREEGFPISERTISRTFKTPQHQVFLDELIRQQLQDITLNRQSNPEAAMKYRDGLLEKLIPKRVEQKLETSGTMEVKTYEQTIEALIMLISEKHPDALDLILQVTNRHSKLGDKR